MLPRPVIVDGATGCFDPARQRRLADEAVPPHVVEQFGLGHDAVTVGDEVGEHVEDLALDVHGLPGPFEPEALEVEGKWAEGVAREPNVPRSRQISP